MAIQSDREYQQPGREYKYDVFLAHNSKDKEFVERIYHKLKAIGLKPWLDARDLDPGVLSYSTIWEVISECKVNAVFLGQAGLGDWQKQEVGRALELYAKGNVRLIPVLLPGVDNISSDFQKAYPFLGLYNWVKFFQSANEVEPLEQLVEAIGGRKFVREPYGILVNVHKPQPSCFLAMPKTGLDLVYQSVKEAVSHVVPHQFPSKTIQMFQARSDGDDHFVEDISEIINVIRSCEVVIGVCLSQDEGFSPDLDVAYELGLAHALGKPLCFITDGSNHHLSNYILRDIPDNDFLKYEPTTSNNQNSLTEDLRKKLQSIVDSLNYPYLVESSDPDIIAIEWRQMQCLLPEFRANFCEFLNFFSNIQKSFLALKDSLIHLYRELEDIDSSFDAFDSDDIIKREVRDVFEAWKNYNKIYHDTYDLQDDSEHLFSLLSNPNFKRLDVSLGFKRNQESAEQSDYPHIIQKAQHLNAKLFSVITQSFPTHHKRLSGILDDEKDEDEDKYVERIFETFKKDDGAANRLVEDANYMINSLISTRIYNRADQIVIMLTKMIHCTKGG